MLDMIVATERLGRPDPRASRGDRGGLVQRQLVYPVDSETPTATCHVQPSAREPALCGYQWEGLVAVPGSPSFDEIDDALRCDRCTRLIATLSS